jgi:HEPN domain-containing protein
MRPLTAEWVAKAEEDFDLAKRERAVSPKPAFDAICFHAQQAAEKYLKAVL